MWAYWNGIDADFVNAIRTKNTIYASGNDYIWTSNHLSHLQFATSFGSIFTPSPFRNTIPNTEGFERRRKNGINAGKDLVKTNLKMAPSFAVSQQLTIK